MHARFYSPHRARRGLTLVEVIVAVGILAMIFAVTLTTFRKFNTKRSIDSDTARIIAELYKARSLTLASKQQDQYGVHFASTSVTLFKSATYTAGTSTNIVTGLDPKTTITSVSLTGGGMDVVFKRISGEVASSGVITLYSASASTTKKITVYGSGLPAITQ